MSVIVYQFQTVKFIQMMSLTFGLFTQVSGSGPLGPLVFVFPSVRPSFRPCVRPVLTFYVKVLREVLFVHHEMALAGGSHAPLGTCSSLGLHCLFKQSSD